MWLLSNNKQQWWRRATTAMLITGRTGRSQLTRIAWVLFLRSGAKIAFASRYFGECMSTVRVCWSVFARKRTKIDTGPRVDPVGAHAPDFLGLRRSRIVSRPFDNWFTPSMWRNFFKPPTNNFSLHKCQFFTKRNNHLTSTPSFQHPGSFHDNPSWTAITKLP